MGGSSTCVLGTASPCVLDLKNYTRPETEPFLGEETRRDPDKRGALPCHDGTLTQGVTHAIHRGLQQTRPSVRSSRGFRGTFFPRVQDEMPSRRGVRIGRLSERTSRPTEQSIPRSREAAASRKGSPRARTRRRTRTTSNLLRGTGTITPSPSSRTRFRTLFLKPRRLVPRPTAFLATWPCALPAPFSGASKLAYTCS